MSCVVGFGGGRALAPARAAALGSLAARVALAGALVRVGCASGADWAVVRAVVAVAPARLLVFCAFGPASSSFGAVRARWAAARGASVVWSAGGSAGSVGAALARRSLALSRSGLSAFVVAPGPRSRGTWLAVAAARAAGVPVSGAFRPRPAGLGHVRGPAAPAPPKPAQQPASSPRVLNIHAGGKGVYVGRGSKWGNPFHIGAHGNRAQVIARYRAWLVQQPALMAALGQLRGKDLVCYCAPLACHGDVLLQLANGTSHPSAGVSGSLGHRSQERSACHV